MAYLKGSSSMPKLINVATIAESKHGTFIARVYTITGHYYADLTAPSLVELVQQIADIDICWHSIEEEPGDA
jgi:hypothetical protein